MISAAGKFLRHVAPGVIKPLHALWNEIIGFVFLVLAGLMIVSTLRRASNDFLLLVAGISFGIVLAGFGVSSFLRARKISRS